MAKYKLVEMADMDKTGTRKVYPKMVTYRTLSTEEFIKKMKWYNNALPTSAIEAALTDMCNILARMLAMGYNVNLDGLGTFSLSLGFEKGLFRPLCVYVMPSREKPLGQTA